MNKITVTVSGPVGSGKSAICGEIEILCRALGLQVEWIGGQQEKNLTHADWTEALEMYQPEIRIVEQVRDARRLTNADINTIAESMPGGLEGFTKGWGWIQFARAVEDESIVLNDSLRADIQQSGG